MATKRRRGATWHYTIRRAGLLPRPIYLSFDDEAEGDEYVRRVEALLARGVVPEEFGAKRSTPTALLSDAVARYMDVQHVSADDAALLDVVLMRLPRALSLLGLTFAWAQAWVTEMKREQNLAPSTIRHYVGALARALDWLAARGEIPTNPLRLLRKGYSTYTPEDAQQVAVVEGTPKADDERDRRLETGEEKAIRATLAGAKAERRQRSLELKHAPALVLLFDMALESAMRLSEMYTLTVDQVDLARHTIFLDRTKNGDKRQVPITTVLGKLLKPYLQGREPGAQVFPWWSGERSRAEMRRCTAQLSRQFARIFETSGCADLRFHDLRHEATARIYERTALTDMQVAKITGHKNLASLRRYANLRASNLAAAMW